MEKGGYYSNLTGPDSECYRKRMGYIPFCCGGECHVRPMVVGRKWHGSQREKRGNYGVAAFESLQESVCAYMLNLNTHFAYADLREKRAELRKNGEKITGLVLVEELKRYSERGEAYVNSLKDMMEYNQLIPADDAYLADGDPIFLVPAPE